MSGSGFWQGCGLGGLQSNGAHLLAGGQQQQLAAATQCDSAAAVVVVVMECARLGAAAGGLHTCCVVCGPQKHSHIFCASQVSQSTVPACPLCVCVCGITAAEHQLPPPNPIDGSRSSSSSSGAQRPPSGGRLAARLLSIHFFVQRCVFRPTYARSLCSVCVCAKHRCCLYIPSLWPSWLHCSTHTGCLARWRVVAQGLLYH